MISSEDYPDSEKKQSSPRNEQAKAAAIITQRQVKYLGLVIEKDDEQLVEIDNEYYMPDDPVTRHYIPIREKYIKIVKQCRNLTLLIIE